MNITDPIRHVARISPNAPAVIRRDGVGVPFRQLDRLIDATAAVLPEFGITAGLVAGLAMTGWDSFPALVVALGMARFGAASADIDLPSRHMNVAILEPGQPPKAEVRNVPNAAIWQRVQQAAAAAPALPSHPDGAAPCRLFGTSGSTGVPKFVAVSHDLMAARVLSAMLALGAERSVRVFAVGLGITLGFSMMLRTLWAGGTAALTDLPNALADIRRHGADALLTSPLVLQQMLTAPNAGAAPESLKLIEVSGSALPAPLQVRARQLLCENIVTWFGTTEAGGVAAAPLAVLRDDPLAVGVGLPGVTIEAVGPEGRTLPPGHEGALRIRSTNLVSGYIDDPAATAAAFRDGWFYSGDLGSVSADGVVRVSGRSAEIINRGGIKISPRLIEEVLISAPQIADAAAFGVPDELGVEQIWAAVVASGPLDGAALTSFCDERLGDKAPKAFLLLGALPRNANGKVRREELVRLALARRAEAARRQP